MEGSELDEILDDVWFGILSADEMACELFLVSGDTEL
jgi:hypothetical protein